MTTPIDKPTSDGTTMTPYYVTFGQRYRRDTHPTFSPAHPDGWVTILAKDDLAARRVAVNWFGTAWCDLYEDEPEQALFPLGELHRIEGGQS